MYDKAFACYKKILDKYPDNKEVLVYIAKALVLMKKKKEAFSYFEKAIKVEGRNYDVYIDYAIAKGEFKIFKDAVELYQKAIEEEPKNHTAHLLLGNLYYDMGQFGEAIKAYEKAIKYDYKDSIAHMSKGNALYMQKDLALALKSYREAIRMCPDNDEYKLIYLQILDEFIINQDNKLKKKEQQLKIKEDLIYERYGIKKRFFIIRWYWKIINFFKKINTKKEDKNAK